MVLKITLDLLRRMEQDGPSHPLQTSRFLKMKAGSPSACGGLLELRVENLHTGGLTENIYLMSSSLLQQASHTPSGDLPVSLLTPASLSCCRRHLLDRRAEADGCVVGPAEGFLRA